MTGALLLGGRRSFLNGRFLLAYAVFLVVPLTVVTIRRPVAAGVAT